MTTKKTWSGNRPAKPRRRKLGMPKADPSSAEFGDW
jgi:hypothetical protein